MKKNVLFPILLLYLSFTTLHSQNPEWIHYDTSNSGLPSDMVSSIVIDGSGNKWIGTDGGGLAVFDWKNWTVYEEPFTFISTIAIDGSENKWIGSWGNLALFDGTNWTEYNESNSGLPSDVINTIAIDGSGDKWIGTYGGGLFQFDGNNWTVYNTSNSGLPSDWISKIAIDGSGDKWIGTYGGGLARFNGTNWMVYDTSNSGLPSNWINSIAIEGNVNMWIGTGNGLVLFDGTYWTVYDTSNSELPADNVYIITIDGCGNKWIVAGYSPYGMRGLVIYKEGGVITSVERIHLISQNPSHYGLEQNYPNPFNPSTTIRYILPKSSEVTLTIYDLLGRKITILVNQTQTPGEYSVIWNGQGHASGIYICRLQTGDFTETRKLVLQK